MNPDQNDVSTALSLLRDSVSEEEERKVSVPCGSTFFRLDSLGIRCIAKGTMKLTLPRLG